MKTFAFIFPGALVSAGFLIFLTLNPKYPLARFGGVAYAVDIMLVILKTLSPSELLTTLQAIDVFAASNRSVHVGELRSVRVVADNFISNTAVLGRFVLTLNIKS